MKLKYLHQNEIEQIVANIRRSAINSRVEYTPIDTENIIYRAFNDTIMFGVEELGGDVLGRYQVSEDGLGLIDIDAIHYETDARSSVEHSIAHELGHDVLHKDLVLGQIISFQDGNKLNYTVEQESKRTYSNLEWQANYFAGALRIPRSELIKLHNNFFSMLKMLGRFRSNLDMYKYLGEHQVKDLIESWAKKFGVSSFSMAVRMKYLGLLDVYGRSFIRYNNAGKVIFGF